jgi:hypothetical protein
MMRTLGKVWTTMILLLGLALALCVSSYATPVTVGNFTVDYVIQSSWDAGATISVTLKNNGPAIQDWTIGWTFPEGQRITNLWNGTYTQSGAAVTVRNAGFNGAIGTGQSANFGFNLSYSGTNTAPISFTVNGSSSTTPVPTPTPALTPTPTGGTVVTPTPNPTGKFHCFLLLGQSNMAGYPKAQASDRVENPRILVLDYDTDQWRIAVPPLHETWQGAIGPGDWFSKTIINELPAGDTIGLIPCAISGEKIETFMKVRGGKYSWIINRAKLAQQRGGVIEGILFHQGESNSGDTSWPGKVKTLVTDLRNDLNLGNVPFLAGELLYSGSCAGHNTLINQLPSVITNCYVISANGLVVDPSDTQWRLHFGHDSQVTLGKRYAEKMIQVLGW